MICMVFSTVTRGYCTPGTSQGYLISAVWFGTIYDVCRVVSFQQVNCQKNKPCMPKEKKKKQNKEKSLVGSGFIRLKYLQDNIGSALVQLHLVLYSFFFNNEWQINIHLQ